MNLGCLLLFGRVLGGGRGSWKVFTGDGGFWIPSVTPTNAHVVASYVRSRIRGWNRSSATGIHAVWVAAMDDNMVLWVGSAFDSYDVLDHLGVRLPYAYSHSFVAHGRGHCLYLCAFSTSERLWKGLKEVPE